VLQISATKALRIVDGDEVLWVLDCGGSLACVWDDVETATGDVVIVLASQSSHVVSIDWSGNAIPVQKGPFLAAQHRRPEQGEILDGTLDDVLALLQQPVPPGLPPEAESVWRTLASTDFFRFCLKAQERPAPTNHSVMDWLTIVDRAATTDAERLAEQGPWAILQDFAQQLEHEGVRLELGPENSVHVNVLGNPPTSLAWPEGVRWNLAVDLLTRNANRWLTDAASKERLIHVGSAEDLCFVLITWDLINSMDESHAFESPHLRALRDAYLDLVGVPHHAS